MQTGRSFVVEALKVGVIGEVALDADPGVVRQYLTQAFVDVSQDFPLMNIAVTGYGFNRGLIGHAYRFATGLMMTTVGIVMPDTPWDNRFPVTYVINADPRPVDFMRYYFRTCDAMIRIGGRQASVLLARELADQERTRLYEYDM